MVFQYPRFDVEIERSVVPERLAWPAPGEAMSEGSLGCNRSYQDLRRLPWSEARRVYSVEENLIARMENSQAPDEECNLIDKEFSEEDEYMYGLDIGVASAVIALSAARCVPFSSCNGGAFGGCHHEWHPVIGFFAKPETAPLLLDCSEESGAGLSPGQIGNLVVYGDDIRKLRGFARALIDRRIKFRNLRFASSMRRHRPRRPQNYTQLCLF